MPAGPHRGIRLIEMLPTIRPNRAYAYPGLEIIILTNANVAYKTVGLFPDTPCGPEQIVRLLQIRFPNSILWRYLYCPRWVKNTHTMPGKK